jgi:zinc transport system permease protein
VIGAGLGAVSALGGMAAAWTFDTPAGPTIVCCAAFLFALSNGLRFAGLRV